MAGRSIWSSLVFNADLKRGKWGTAKCDGWIAYHVCNGQPPIKATHRPKTSTDIRVSVFALGLFVFLWSNLAMLDQVLECKLNKK